MADQNTDDYDIYSELDTEGAASTREEDEAATQKITGKSYYGDDGFLETGRTDTDPDYTMGQYQEDLRLITEEAKRQAARREAGLSGEKMFAQAEKLKDIAEGRRKTEGQIEAERELEILAKGQRGLAMSYGGFDIADVLQRAGRAAQEAELAGETAIATSARRAARAARDQLDDLMIAGEQRAEDRAFALQQLAFQESQASGSLWSNVLGGVLGAIGAVVGAVVPGGGVVGAMVGASVGKAIGGAGGSAIGQYRT